MDFTDEGRVAQHVSKWEDSPITSRSPLWRNLNRVLSILYNRATFLITVINMQKAIIIYCALFTSCTTTLLYINSSRPFGKRPATPDLCAWAKPPNGTERSDQWEWAKEGRGPMTRREVKVLPVDWSEQNSCSDEGDWAAQLEDLSLASSLQACWHLASSLK